MWCYDPCGGVEKAAGSEFLEREQIDPLFIEQRVPRYMFRLMGARRSALLTKGTHETIIGPIFVPTK